MTSASIVTATTIAVPLKKIFQNSETFSSVKPSCIVADEERAEHRAEHRAGAAEDVYAADHDRGDDVELEPRSGDGVDGREAGGEHEPAESRERAADRERRDHPAADGDARVARGVRVRSDRVEVAAPGRPAQDAAPTSATPSAIHGQRREPERLRGREV